jgi:3',5'-cyclic AMP phosphodiesterase CpdA
VRIAHLSDLHLLSLEGVGPFRLLNKRLTGYMNLRFRRHAIHKPFAVHAAARAIRRMDIDHVVITGDVSNLALEREFDLVERFLLDELRFDPERISLVPGNHDAYTQGSHKSRRFLRHFAPFLKSDLPELTSRGPLGAFPFVHFRGPVAFIGLSTALPRLPLVASGQIGRSQLEALDRVLDHPEVRSRTPIVLQHHPWHNPASLTKWLLEGLIDAHLEGRLLRRIERGLLLHGHLHRRIHRTMPTESGHIDAVGATSASLLHASDERMAGFNVYEVAGDGAITAITSHRLVPETQAFREVPIPRA